MAPRPFLRRAEEKDLDVIMRIKAASMAIMQADGNGQWADDYPAREDFAADIREGTLFVEELDGRVRGMICVNSDEPEEYAGHPWRSALPAMVIHRFATDPECRRQGVGSRLLNFTAEHAAKNGYNYIKTDTNSQNPAMQALFASCGYKKVGNICLKIRGTDVFYCYDKLLGE